jgi:hypothetical protein
MERGKESQKANLGALLYIYVLALHRMVLLSKASATMDFIGYQITNWAKFRET